MAWFGGRNRRWPGRGPFSDLPPWQRPGLTYRRRTYSWFLNPSLSSSYDYLSPYAMPHMGSNPYNTTKLTEFPISQTPLMPLDQELQYLEDYKKGIEAELKDLEEELRGVEARINELKKSLQPKK